MWQLKATDLLYTCDKIFMQNETIKGKICFFSSNITDLS